MTKFTEDKLEQTFIQLLAQQNIPHVLGHSLNRDPSDVLLRDQLTHYLKNHYASEQITDNEIQSIIKKLDDLPAADLYHSNKQITHWVMDGFPHKRDDPNKKDLYIKLIDYSQQNNNHYQLISQLPITGYEKRIPDLILYLNGLPLIVFELKSTIRENVTLHNAYTQLTTRYKRDIPALFKYNAFCILSDGINNKIGSFFAPYDFYYTWRNNDKEPDLHTLIKDIFNPDDLRQLLQHFTYIPDKSYQEEKIFCRYPQYYAATKLYQHIGEHRQPKGNGKGGTYFGATGCGKSYTMLFLSRLLMKSLELGSPTIILITDRTDLDDQLAAQFTNSKHYLGDANVISITSRAHLRELLSNRKSGGIFLTTIHKFTEDTQLLTKRNNVFCISDEAHRSQINLDQKISVTDKGIRRHYGFAKYLHDSLPNATYVGFTGTPIDATLDVFGEVVDAYTMSESARDNITVHIVYEGRAAKIILDNSKLKEIENYYQHCAELGSNDYQINESKKAMAQMSLILGDPDRLRALAQDFIQHYETRVTEGATVNGKAMFVASNRDIAYRFYQEIIALRPDWAVPYQGEKNAILTKKEKQKLKAIEKIKLVMTRSQDDDKKLYELLGNQAHRKELDRQFKQARSNFKIAIVVDMWLTGFDVPFLDTIYIDKPLQKHNLIQTISRVNRNYPNKEKGLVVDYIGIKTQMNQALAHYSDADHRNFEDIATAIKTVKDDLELLAVIFHKFDSQAYFSAVPAAQFQCLHYAVEYVQQSQLLEQRFMNLVKRLKAAYDICCSSDEFSDSERDTIHFYFAIRSIIFKLTKNDAPDIAQMNQRVRDMVAEALRSEGVEELFKMGAEKETDIFDEKYLAQIAQIQLPNTKIKLLQKLLTQAIDEFKKVNKVKGIEFSEKFKALVARYNERDEQDKILDEFSEEIISLYEAMKKEQASFSDKGINFEEKAFYDILYALANKYHFSYPEESLLILAKKVKEIVDETACFVDWNNRADLKAKLKVNLIKLLAKYDYPPAIDRHEVYQEIFEQAENFKAHQLA